MQNDKYFAYTCYLIPSKECVDKKQSNMEMKRACRILPAGECLCAVCLTSFCLSTVFVQRLPS